MSFRRERKHSMATAAIFAVLAILSLASVSLADTYRRLVNFEWEAIPGASIYEIEIAPVKTTDTNKAPYNFKSQNPAWSGKLTPGTYTMKLRSKDHRGVPGKWSSPEEFQVALEKIKLISPTVPTSGLLQIVSKEEGEHGLQFSWEPLGTNVQYKITLESTDGKFKKEFTTPESTLKIGVPVASSYDFKISGIATDSGITSEEATKTQITILGKQLDRPVIDKPESNYVRFLRWSKPNKTESFDMSISRREKNGKWKVMKNVAATTDSNFDFPYDWPGGEYRIAVKGNAPMRASSDKSELNFSVLNGNRSPAAEFNATVRKSIEKITGWYGIASYLITQINYNGENPEKNAKTSYSALGGTGRLGIGYSIPNSAWGAQGIVDLSGYIIGKQNFTFASSEIHAIKFQPVGERSEVRFIVGLFTKEMPETLGSGLTQTYEMKKVNEAGPHFGAEYWYSLNPKFGFQFNSHIYLNMIGLATPNGQSLAPSMSYQFGFLGSYKLSPRITGLMGYALRTDKSSYWAIPGDVNDPSNQSFASAGDKNETTISGNYLNLFLEYGF